MAALENNTISGLQQNSNPQAVANRPAAPKATPATKVDSPVAEKARKMQTADLESHQQDAKREGEQVTKAMLERGVEKLQKLAEYISENTHLVSRDYRIHEETNRISVKIYDSVTGEVIKEIPGSEFLDRIAKMEQLMGLIFDDMV